MKGGEERVQRTGSKHGRNAFGRGLTFRSALGGIPSDRLGAWGLICGIQTACWWEARPGPIPVEEAARTPEVLTAPSEGELLGFHVLVRAGSAHDPVGMEGLSCGLVRAQWTQSIAGDRVRQERLSASDDFRWETSVGPELVRYSAWGPSSLAEDMTSLLMDTVVAGEFFDTSTDTSVWSSPNENPVHRRLLDWLYAGHPYGHGTLCDLDPVNRFGTIDMEQFHEDRFTRVAIRLVSEIPTSGPDADTLGILEQQSERVMELSPRLYDDVTPRAIPRPMRGRLAYVEESPGELWLGWATELHPGHPDWPAMLLAIEILGMRLSPERFVGLHTSPEWLDGDGGTPDWIGLPLVLGWSGVTDPLALFDGVLPQLDDWLDGPFTAAEIDRSRSNIAERMTTGHVFRAAQANLLGNASGWVGFDESLARIDGDAIIDALRRNVLLSDLRVIAGMEGSAIFSWPRIEDSEESSVDGASQAPVGWIPGEPFRIVISEL